MRPLSPLPEWVQLEHQVALILTEQEEHGWYFDERAARSLNLLSEESMKILVKYYETGILTSKEQDLLLNELTEQKGTMRVLERV